MEKFADHIDSSSRDHGHMYKCSLKYGVDANLRTAEMFRK